MIWLLNPVFQWITLTGGQVGFVVVRTTHAVVAIANRSTTVVEHNRLPLVAVRRIGL